MKTEYWPNTSANYYDNQPGLDVTEAGVTAQEEPPRTGPVWYTTNIWAGACYHVHGVPLLGYEPDPRTGRWAWCFDNTGDRARALDKEFRIPGAMVVPILEFQASYRQLARARNDATGSDYRNGRNDRDWHGRQYRQSA